MDIPKRFVDTLLWLACVAEEEALEYFGVVPIGSLLLGLREAYDGLDTEDKLTDQEYYLIKNSIVSREDPSIRSTLSLLEYLESNYFDLIR